MRLNKTELFFECTFGALCIVIITLRADSNTPMSEQLKITNDWNVGLLFKIKTTNPER